MSCRLPKLRRLSSVGLAAAALSLLLLAGCAGGPSQEELSLLDGKRLSAEAAEMKVVELKAEKARLERRIAEKRAEKKALQQRLEAVQSAVANWSSN
jgi:outer membrane murein-binding lipoprotein Lpp